MRRERICPPAAATSRGVREQSKMTGGRCPMFLRTSTALCKLRYARFQRPRPHAKTPHFRAAPFTLITLRGENEIRTRDTLLEYTRFPGVPLKPLEHLSLDSGAKVILFPESLANFLFARQRKPTAAPLRRRQHPHGQCRRALSPRSGRPRPSCSPVRAA